MTTTEATWTMTFVAINCPDMPDIYGPEKHAEHLWRDNGETVYCPGLD